jgi:hypothetical protein
MSEGNQYTRFLKYLSNYLGLKYNDTIKYSKKHNIWDKVKESVGDTKGFGNSDYDDKMRLFLHNFLGNMMDIGSEIGELYNPNNKRDNITMTIDDIPAPVPRDGGLTMDIQDLPEDGDIFDEDTEEDTDDEDLLPEDEDFDAETDEDEEEEEMVKPKRFGRFGGKSHPYYNDFKHIRDRERMKGGGIWGDIWNGVSSVLKPALAIFGGPIGVAASALVPSISKDGGVKMLGQKL